MDSGPGPVHFDHVIPVCADGSLSVAHYSLSSVFGSVKKNIKHQLNGDGEVARAPSLYRTRTFDHDLVVSDFCLARLAHETFKSDENYSQ